MFVTVPIHCRQLDVLRKQVASLEQAIQAKDRENVTNRAMYDNMKGVSRKIKEVIWDGRAQTALAVDFIDLFFVHFFHPNVHTCRERTIDQSPCGKNAVFDEALLPL